jgi:hypothetical protein
VPAAKLNLRWDSLVVDSTVEAGFYLSPRLIEESKTAAAAQFPNRQILDPKSVPVAPARASSAGARANNSAKDSKQRRGKPSWLKL